MIDISKLRSVALKAQRTSPGTWKTDAYNDESSEFVMCSSGPVVQVVHEDDPEGAILNVRGVGRGAFEDIMTYVEQLQPSVVLELLSELEALRGRS